MDVTPAAHAAALWVGLHLILLLVLSVLVVRQRRKHHVVFGDGGEPELIQAIRAFGNATEYVPTGMVALAVLALAGAPPMVIHPVGAALLVGRAAHAFGLSRSGESSLPRTAGVMVTWVAYIAAAATLIFYAIP
jgi:uncharacterized membrane protein YecN with MAPEG domain